MMRGTSRGSLRTRTTSPASTATSVPAPNRNGHIRCEQCRSVVHTVADHCDAFALALQFLDLVHLVAGEHLGEHLVDAQVGGHGVGNSLGIASQHDHLHVLIVQSLDGIS